MCICLFGRGVVVQSDTETAHAHACATAPFVLLNWFAAYIYNCIEGAAQRGHRRLCSRARWYWWR